MTLRELLRAADVNPPQVRGDALVHTISMDSRRITPGAMFVCMPSKNTDTNALIPAAVAAGATAVLTFSPEGVGAAVAAGAAAVLLPKDQYQDNLWKLCKVAFGNPTASMKLIGVTGTNGKTTTAWLIRDMLAALGMKAGYLGTLGFQIPGEERELSNTTPFVIETYQLMAEARDKGVEAMAIEVSSHALAEKRVEGLEFDAAIFTNLTQDHLDFHGTMEEYAAAKLRLFTELPKQTNKVFRAAVNVGDQHGASMALKLQRPFAPFTEPVITYEVLERKNGIRQRHSSRPSVRLYGEPTYVRVDHIELEITTLDMPSKTTGKVRIGLGGSYNVENSLSAAAGLVALGFSLDGVRHAISHVRPVPGRFEAVRNDTGIGVLVDYAHTPDAVEKLLDAARPLTKGRLITVFGCGGDRDKAKRPLMAKAASERSDLTVVTSDNPRTEDPQAILNDVLGGIAPGRESIAIIDRREAIHYAIRHSKPGDVVVIAGKGHENYQIIGKTKFPMDDRELAREALENL